MNYLVKMLIEQCCHHRTPPPLGSQYWGKSPKGKLGKSPWLISDTAKRHINVATWKMNLIFGFRNSIHPKTANLVNMNRNGIGLIQTEVMRRRRKAGVIQWTEKGLRSCLYVYLYLCYVCILVCFSGLSRDWRHLRNRKWYHMVGCSSRSCF